MALLEGMFTHTHSPVTMKYVHIGIAPTQIVRGRYTEGRLTAVIDQLTDK